MEMWKCATQPKQEIVAHARNSKTYTSSINEQLAFFLPCSCVYQSLKI